MSQEANLWDVSVAPTIVMTQRGARTDFQRKLRARGVEVVEFDFLTPYAVAAYCYDRGFLQCLWECGGTLSAPAIAAGVIHKTLAFIAPKLVRPGSLLFFLMMHYSYALDMLRRVILLKVAPLPSSNDKRV